MTIAQDSRSLRPTWLPLAVLLIAGSWACGRLGLRRSASSEPASERPTPPVALEPIKLSTSAPGSAPQRILLDNQALAWLRESAQKRTPAFLRAQRRADEALQKSLESGYQGFEWADAVAGSALLWHATGDERYATSALRYLNALLDDRLAVGDAKGGADVVTHDSGYGMRTFGVYSALGYDWLRAAPGMNDALRARIRQRLGQWLTLNCGHGQRLNGHAAAEPCRDKTGVACRSLGKQAYHHDPKSRADALAVENARGDQRNKFRRADT